MNKAEFVGAVAEAAELSKTDAANAVDAMINVPGPQARRPPGPQSEDRRDHQDQGVEESFVQGWQGAEGCRKLINSPPMS